MKKFYCKQFQIKFKLLTKDLKTLRKSCLSKIRYCNFNCPVFQNLLVLNEDVLTKHLLKLNEIEDQFRELTNKFEEVNFKLDKLSSRVTKIQSDSQLRFSDLETGSKAVSTKKKTLLPGSSKPQDFGAHLATNIKLT
jgi:TolA-binding protein